MPDRLSQFLTLLALALALGSARAAEPAPPAKPEAKPEGDPAAILRAYFAEADAAKRPALAARFAAVAPKSWDDLKKMLHEAAPRPPLPAGRHTFEAKPEGGAAPVKYLLRVPEGYAGEPARGWPLIVSSLYKLAGGPEPSMDAIEGWLGADRDRYLIAVAQPPRDGPFEPDRAYLEHPLHVLADVRQRANIDSDRILLMGHLKSGYLAWVTALFSPGEWAASVPIMSRPFTEAGAIGCTLYMPNVLNLAIQAHWGAEHLDANQKEGNGPLSREAAAELARLGARKFEGIEYPGEGRIGHVNTDRLRPFVAAARRDPFPAECRLIFHRLFQGRNYYVRATAAAKPEFEFRARHAFKPVAGESPEKALRNLIVREAYELTARMPPGANTLTVLARNLREIEIELSAERLDFTKPIRITANSRAVQWNKPLDYAELLETARRTGDFERLIGGRLKMPVPAGPTQPLAP